jgi:ribose-phosphate pyrophosphokinase
MIIIAGNSHPNLAKAIAKKLSLPIFLSNTKKFLDQELRIRLEGNFDKQDVIIIQSTSKPANDHLMELLLLTETVKRSGAKSITAIVPYFGYGRQDKNSYKNEPISISLLALLLKASGIDKIITLDLHSKESENFFKIDIENLDPSLIFIPLIDKSNNNIVVSPDAGGIIRAKNLSRLLSTELAVISKKRDSNGGCSMNNLTGSVTGKNCILIDDIVDTGETICLAAKFLIEKGAKSVDSYITHAVLSGKSIEKIENSPLRNFYVTNSINQKNIPKKIKVISVEDILANSIRALI